MEQSLYDIDKERLSGPELAKNVAILGSAPSAPTVSDLLGIETIVVAVNNAYRAAPRYEYFVYSGDFPKENKPLALGIKGRTTPQYYPAMVRFGGLLYCGATMAFAAGYWAINDFPFSQISYFASDMVYTGEQTHFYNGGSPDPIRVDISLQSLEAKSLRLFYFGIMNDVLILNASSQTETRLRIPHIPSGLTLKHTIFKDIYEDLIQLRVQMKSLADPALQLEANGDFDFRRHDYWVHMDDQRVWNYIRNIDERWLELAPAVDTFSRIIEEKIKKIPT